MKCDTRQGDLQQLSNVGTNRDTRVTNAEELVDETSSSHEDDTDEPSTEGAGRHHGVIMVIDNGANFGIRGIDDDQGSFDPELLIHPLVLKRIVPESLIELVPVGCLEYARREVWILAVLVKQRKRWDQRRVWVMLRGILTFSRMWSITSSISSRVILLACSVASMISGPRAWISVASPSFETS